jgi:hypothetical protein
LRMQAIHYVKIKALPRSATIEAESSEESKNRVLYASLIVIHGCHSKST